MRNPLAVIRSGIRPVKLSPDSIKMLVEAMREFSTQIAADEKASDDRTAQSILREMAHKNQAFFARLAEQNVTIARDLATANRDIAEKLVTTTQEIASQQNLRIACQIEVSATDRDVQQRQRGKWLVALNSGICLAILLAVAINGINIHRTQQMLERAITTIER